MLRSWITVAHCLRSWAINAAKSGHQCRVAQSIGDLVSDLVGELAIHLGRSEQSKPARARDARIALIAVGVTRRSDRKLSSVAAVAIQCLRKAAKSIERGNGALAPPVGRPKRRRAVADAE